MDSFGDRMKLYEMAEAGRKLMSLLPVMARIDGRAFSSFTRGMDRPYDKRMSDLMVETTRFLVEETGACMGYTQSDEISLAWYSNDYKTQIFFDGRIQKMTSQLAALATVKFNNLLPNHLPAEYTNKLPTFDARVWNVPNVIEGANCFLWREQDATKNSISMAAQSFYSHKELMNRNGSEKQEMLFKKGVNWNDYPAFFRRGVYIQRRQIDKAFTVDEIEKLPIKHSARNNPGLIVSRSEIRVLDVPPLSKIINRVDVLFYGAEPVVKEIDG